MHRVSDSMGPLARGLVWEGAEEPPGQWRRELREALTLPQGLLVLAWVAAWGVTWLMTRLMLGLIFLGVLLFAGCATSEENDGFVSLMDCGAVTRAAYFLDADQDGYGDGTAPISACAMPAGYAEQAGDCADDDPLRNPGAEEVCDGVDNNCNGDTDEGLLTWYYLDADGDGVGDEDQALAACGEPRGAVTVAGDCDDRDPEVQACS